MSQEELLLERWRDLSPQKQQELLNIAGQFAASDEIELTIAHTSLNNTASPTSKRSLKGLWANQPTNISYEEIQALRREMWSNFPREEGL